MDFIERMFGVSPDGGDGTFELLIFGAVMIALAVIALRSWRRARGGEAGPPAHS